MFETAENQLQTQILTYPLDLDANPYPDLNRYLTNLRKNKGLVKYMSALELTKKGQFHFHMLLDIPFTPVQEYVDAWNAAKEAKTTQKQRNSVRDVRVVSHELAVLKYCFKYLSKKGSKEHALRKFTCSRSLCGYESKMVTPSEFNRFRLHSEAKNDYCRWGRVEIKNDFLAQFNSFT